jgi:hypothetical protein
MSYSNTNSEGTNSLGNLLTYLITGVVLVYIWNGLVWLFFRHFGWGYVPINLWTPFLGWVMLVAFAAPSLFAFHATLMPDAIVGSSNPATYYAHPNAWLWSFLTVPLMLLFLRAFPKTDE